MKLNVMFTITAIVLILLGLLSFFAPPALAGTDPTAGFSAKINGVVCLALGVMAWLVRNDDLQKRVTRSFWVTPCCLPCGPPSVYTVHFSLTCPPILFPGCQP